MPAQKAIKFDFKKAFKECYGAKPTPSLIRVPPLSFLAIEGSGNPNEPNGDYQAALQALYTLSYTIKMSKEIKALKDYMDYVVPPLEGLWWSKNPLEKEQFKWQMMIAQPKFVSHEVLQNAREEAARKKGLDSHNVRLLSIEEGLCAQILHCGSYDDEPQSMAKLEEFLARNALVRDSHSRQRTHHEIYLSNPNKTPPHKLKTILRIPVRAHA